MPHSIMRVDIAGRDVTRHLRLLLRKEGINFRTTAEFEIVRTIKERACYLANNPQKEESIETEKFKYVLPDGSHLEVNISIIGEFWDFFNALYLFFYWIRLAQQDSERQKFSSDQI